MYKVIKRFLDIVMASILLIIISPVFIIIIVILSLTGEKEIFYTQERVGKNGKPFGIFKFATMLKDSLNLGSKTVTVKNDPRITPFGQILRKSKLNELPQLLNVIKGDMSFIGPRPLLVSSFAKYSAENQEQISQMVPGVTGIGSIIFRNEERLIIECRNVGIEPLEYYKTEIYPYKGALECWYRENQSFLLDMKILFLTVWQVVKPNSNVVYYILSNLPKKPKNLTIEGVRQLSNKSIRK